MSDIAEPVIEWRCAHGRARHVGGGAGAEPGTGTAGRESRLLLNNHEWTAVLTA
ncbi:MAG: hypothetical protein ABSA93_06560 [Streptosporangiaceae bacterium]